MDRSPTLVSLTIGLLILSAAFWLVERWRPSLPAQRRDWRQTWTDLAYWFFTPLVTRVATRIALGVVFALVALSQGLTLDELRRVATTRQTWASTLPVWTQIPMVMLLADLMAYWTHRLFHGRTLWSFHAIHHSSRTVDWLSSVRLHPVNDVVSRIVQVLPLYWMGFNAGVLAGFVPFLTLYALLLHANVSWTYRPAAISDREPDVPSLASHVGRRRTGQELRRPLPLHRSRLRHVLHAARPSTAALRHHQR